jgi:hypothetical protein
MNLKTIVVLLFIASSVFGQTPVVSPKIEKEGKKILSWTQESVIVEAIKKQNKAEKPIEEIQKLDREWVEGSVSEDFVKTILEGACAEKLKELEKDIAGAAESFVMDAQGALVCSSKKTSDYWQGDEPKWKNAFDGATDLVYGTRNYDESSKATLMHISAPVKENDKPIGVISVGINLMVLSEN